jgi:acid phosphatase
MLALFERLQATNVTLNGDLAFANDWQFFTSTPAEHFESLVSTGVYAGTLEAFTTGVKLRTRYKDLLDEALRSTPISFWASDSERVIDTARYFGTGFFGIDWKDQATLQVIPETAERGADTLTPGRTCLRYRENADAYGHDYGYRMMDELRSVYEPAIIDRLAKHNPRFPFIEDEIFTMQMICGFETIVKGESPWCSVFTHDEMQSFEYARDVIHYYRAGPGNPYGPSLGWLWLNATAGLLREGSSAGPMFFSLSVPSSHIGELANGSPAFMMATSCLY